MGSSRSSLALTNIDCNRSVSFSCSFSSWRDLMASLNLARTMFCVLSLYLMRGSPICLVRHVGHSSASTNHSNKAMFDDSVIADGAALLASLAFDALNEAANN